MPHDTPPPLRAWHEAYVPLPAAARSGAARDVPLNVLRPGAASGRAVRSATVEFIPYGLSDHTGAARCDLVASYGQVELEYAAIRRGAGMFDSPHRGTLVITGAAGERREFLNRMVTQELKDLRAGLARPAFWLNRKGRIQADLLLIELGDRMLVDVDIHQAATTLSSLGEFLFAEDMRIENASDQFHHLALHGRRAGEVLCAASHHDVPIEGGAAAIVTIDGIETVMARRDQTGEPGFELIVPYDSVLKVWTKLIANNARPIGWHAFNIARIEAGTPLFNIDFGLTNLPHETSLLEQRVSFSKGCYLGQEVVARMHHLGKPKQKLMGLRLLDDRLPVAGAAVSTIKNDGSADDPIGVITSSTLSPMLAAQPIAFAMVKTAKVDAGQQVLVEAEGEQARATISEQLQFWSAASPVQAHQ